MADIVLKYSLLNNSARKEVNDFSFSSSKAEGEKRQFLSSYKKKILG